MASVYKKMALRGGRKIDITDLKNNLTREINAELVCDSLKYFENAVVVLLSFEKDYFRTGSYASLTVMLTQNENEQPVDIIGSGGGEGLFNISWGANSNFAENAVRILEQYGFSQTN